MRNIVRTIVYVGLLGVGGLYRYQNPTWYQDLIDRSKTQITSNTTTGGVNSGKINNSTETNNNTNTTSGSVDSGESIIDLIAQQLSGSNSAEASGSEAGTNPFGEVYVSVPQPSQTTAGSSVIEGKDQGASYQDTAVPDTSICAAPRGRLVAGGDWTLAFISNQANSDNICVIEKRICTQGVLGGSYTQHTCYFNQPNGQYEYLGVTGADSTTLIFQVEQQLGIGSNNTQQEANNGQPSKTYVDDTQGVSNYALIDASSIPSGRTSNGGYTNGNSNNQTTSEEYFDLGPIIARTPETKISATQEQRINPNRNGVQGIIKTTANSPRLSYSTDSIKLDPTEPARAQYTCNTPRGTQTFHNQHVIAFEASSVPQGQLCKSELRTCTYGYLRGSYTHETCTIAGVNNTNTNNLYSNRGYYHQGNYYNNTYDYRYYKNNGDYDANRYDNRYYQTNNYSYKSPRTPNDSCLVDNYGFIGHGSTLTMYERLEVGPDDKCRSIMRTCDDGDLSGSGKYRYTSCTQLSQGLPRLDPGGYRPNDNPPAPVSETVYRVQNPKSTSTISNGYNNSCYTSRRGWIDHTSSVKAFKTSSVTTNKKCEYEYRVCNNGKLSGSYGYNTCTIGSDYKNQSTNDEYYYVTPYRYDDYNDDYYNYRPTQYDSHVRSYGTKSDPNAGSCTVTDYGLLRDSDFLIMYRETNPAPGTSCQSTTRTCSNGSLSGPSDYTKLRCNETSVSAPIAVCGNAIRESGEQCDHKDLGKSGRGSGGCSLACTPIEQITVIEEKCYDYTDTAKLCNGKNGGTVQDACTQIRSCPIISTSPGKVQFMAREEINGNRAKDTCELYVSDVSYTLVHCNNTNSLVTPQTTYNHVIENVSPGSYQIIARPIYQYGKSGYRPQRPDPRPGDPVNQTFKSQCFDVKSGETTHIRAGFKAPMSIDDKTHPRWIFEPSNGQKELYENPRCS